jgi:hypothetical protein
MSGGAAVGANLLVPASAWQSKCVGWAERMGNGAAVGTHRPPPCGGSAACPTNEGMLIGVGHASLCPTYICGCVASVGAKLFARNLSHLTPPSANTPAAGRVGTRFVPTQWVNTVSGANPTKLKTICHITSDLTSVVCSFSRMASCSTREHRGHREGSENLTTRSLSK